eukprot:UN29423
MVTNQDDYDGFKKGRWKYFQSAYTGGRMDRNLFGEDFNIELITKELYNKYAEQSLKEWWPLIFVQDYPEMFYELYSRTLFYTRQMQMDGTIDKNIPFIIFYPISQEMPIMYD